MDQEPRRTNRRRRNLLRRLSGAQGDLCFLCGTLMRLPEPGVRYASADNNSGDFASLDHVVPRALGGSNRIDNLVASHRECNSRRGHRPATPAEVMRLAALNEARNGVISDIREIMDAHSFGPETPGTLYLVDLLGSFEGREGVRIRHRAGRAIDRFNADMAALRDVPDLVRWERIACLVRDDALRRTESLRSLDARVASLVGSVISSIMNIRRRERRERHAAQANERRRARERHLAASSSDPGLHPLGDAASQKQESGS